MRNLFILAALMASICTDAANPLYAQVNQPVGPTSPPGTDTANVLTVEIVEGRKKQALDSDLGSDKEKVLQLYDQALKELADAAQWEKGLKRYADMAKNAESDLQKAQAELANVGAAPPIDDSLSLAELESLLKQKQSDLESAQKQAADMEGEPRRRTARTAEIPGLIKTAQEKLAGWDKEISSSPPPNELLALTLAKKTHLLARRQTAMLTINAYEAERAAYAATKELLSVQSNLASEQAKRLGQQVAQLQQRVSDLQKAEDAQTRRALLQRISAAHPTVRSMVDAFRQLTLEGERLAEKNVAAQKELSDVEQLLTRVKTQYKRTEDRVNAGGLTNSIGLLLRKQRAELPDTQQYQRSVRNRQQTIRSTQLRLYELHDRREDLKNEDAQIAALLAKIAGDRRGFKQVELESVATDIVQSEREYLAALIPRYDSYFETLIKLDETQNALGKAILEYRDYIDQRVLWIRSTSAPSLEEGRRLWSSIQWLGSPRNWRQVGVRIWSDAWTNMALAIVVAFPLALLFYFQQRLRKRVGGIGRTALADPSRSLWAGLQTLLYTVSIAVMWPAVMAIVGWRLASQYDTDFARAIGSGLLAGASAFFLIELLRQVCRERGLAEAHFRWQTAATGQIRRLLRPMIFIVVPLVFVVVATEHGSAFAGDDALGRLTFVVLCLVLAWLAHQLLRAKGAIIHSLVARNRQSWIARLQRLWHLSGVGVPLAFAAIALAGYYYTALRLTTELQMTLWFFFILMLATQLVRRWLFVAKTRLARRQKRELEKQAAERSQKDAENREAMVAAASGETNVVAVGPPDAGAKQLVDTVKISEQSLRLLHASAIVAAVIGLYWIWVDVLPALGIFRQVTVWETTIGSDKVRAITMADLMLAVLIAVLAYIAARNIPGMLEISVLQRLSLDRGSSYAITTVARYVIVLVGLFFFAGFLGVSWSKIQWLAAALTIGLGFGLQEIFANFVSGLILLAERPVRVGDVVTVGDVNGTITKIQMRATTIQEWNRRELLVPNKELVTGKVINWTLSDSIYRVDLKVGIAYGSNTELARQVLLDVAAANPEVLKEPKPKCIFRCFGDSTLDFELRVYIPHIDYWPRVVTAANMAIDQQFRANKIEIAFPQRDLHIRSISDSLPIVAADGNFIVRAKQTEKDENVS